MPTTGEDHLLKPKGQCLIQGKNENEELGFRGYSPRGISFSQVNVNGYVEANAFQHTFASCIRLIPSSLKTMAGIGAPRQKVQILRDLDGLIRPGEMLLVLGRPGSGCTTFLKTMSGYLNGVEVEETQPGGIMYDGQN